MNTKQLETLMSYNQAHSIIVPLARLAGEIETQIDFALTAGRCDDDAKRELRAQKKRIKAMCEVMGWK